MKIIYSKHMRGNELSRFVSYRPSFQVDFNIVSLAEYDIGALEERLLDDMENGLEKMGYSTSRCSRNCVWGSGEWPLVVRINAQNDFYTNGREYFREHIEKDFAQDGEAPGRGVFSFMRMPHYKEIPHVRVNGEVAFSDVNPDPNEVIGMLKQEKYTCHPVTYPEEVAKLVKEGKNGILKRNYGAMLAAASDD